MKDASNAALAGQVAVITGAGRGIGAAIATTLASLGAQTVWCGRSRESLENTPQPSKIRAGRVPSWNATVADLRSVDSVAERINGIFW